jgi:hypothetical protein
VLKLDRFRWDVQVPGRYFSAGMVLRAMVGESSAIIPPIAQLHPKATLNKPSIPRSARKQQWRCARGEAAKLRRASLYLASDSSRKVTGIEIVIDGGGNSDGGVQRGVGYPRAPSACRSRTPTTASSWAVSRVG